MKATMVILVSVAMLYAFIIVSKADDHDQLCIENICSKLRKQIELANCCLMFRALWPR